MAGILSSPLPPSYGPKAGHSLSCRDIKCFYVDFFENSNILTRGDFFVELGNEGLAWPVIICRAPQVITVVITRVNVRAY